MQFYVTIYNISNTAIVPTFLSPTPTNGMNITLNLESAYTTQIILNSTIDNPVTDISITTLSDLAKSQLRSYSNNSTVFYINITYLPTSLGAFKTCFTGYTNQDVIRSETRCILFTVVNITTTTTTTTTITTTTTSITTTAQSTSNETSTSTTQTTTYLTINTTTGLSSSITGGSSTTISPDVANTNSTNGLISTMKTTTTSSTASSIDPSSNELMNLCKDRCTDIILDDYFFFFSMQECYNFNCLCVILTVLAITLFISKVILVIFIFKIRENITNFSKVLLFQNARIKD
jgi:hypothetical protein